MDWYVRAFIRSSLLWLVTGVVIGLLMAFRPEAGMAYRTAHIHANALGFISMMIFGVAYHVVPRFVGAPLWRSRMAAAHVFVANLGLALLVGGWVVRPHAFALGGVGIRAGAGIAAIGVLLFVVNIWRTMDRRPAPRPVAISPAHRPTGPEPTPA